MITLYVLKQSRAQRIAWLLEELQLDYQIEVFDRDSKTQLAPAEMRKIHPLGKSPTIKDGDLVLAESGAIVEYLIQKYSNGRLAIQPDQAEYAQYLHWLHYAEGSLAFPLVLQLIFRKIEESPMPFFVKPIAKKITGQVRTSLIAPQLKLHFDYVEQALKGKSYFVGEQLTGADFMMGFPLQAVKNSEMLASLPNIRAYVERIENTESYLRAEQKLGKLELGKI